MKKKNLCKYNVQIIAAIVMLIFGMVMTVWGFILDPEGVVPDSVLNVFGRCLMFSGSMLGVGAYVNARFSEIDQKLDGRNQEGKV